MADPSRIRLHASTSDPQARYLRRTWWVLGASYAVLAALTLVELASGASSRFTLALPLLIVVTAIAAILSLRASQALEQRRRSEIESFARILHALSRSVSPDAIVAAIVEELGEGSGADHVVFVRLRADADLLDATLVTMRPGVPSSTTILPVTALDDVPVGPDREPVAIPIMQPRVMLTTPSLAIGSSGSAAATTRRTGAGGAIAGIFDEIAHTGSSDLTARDGGDGRPALRAPVSSGRSGPSVRSGPGSIRGASTRRREAAARRHEAAADRIAEQIAARVRPVYGLRNTLAAPLRSDDGVIGAIVLSRRTGGPWSEASRRLLDGSAAEASAALHRVYSQHDAEVRASTDALTGLPNRRYFDEFCGLLARRRRAADTVGILMVDIDHFKRLNDRHGHPVGDAVLREVARAVAASVREDDIPARYGGEEFVVLLRNPTRAMALDIGERVRCAVRALDLAPLGVPQVTVSVGVAVSNGPEEPIGELTVRADRALYRAKRAGRDRVGVEA